MSEITTTQLACGLLVVAEPIASMSSVAATWLLPAGTAADPVGADGVSVMLSEMIFRGAGGLTSRELSDSLDRVGFRRSAQPRSHHLEIDVTGLGSRFDEALPLIVSLVLEPALPDDALEPVRSLCLQTLDGLQDEPQVMTMIRLRERHLPAPFNRSGYGDRTDLESITRAALAEMWDTRAVPGGSILAVAGAIDPATLVKQLDTRLASWTGAAGTPDETAAPQRGYRHLDQDTAQMHIALAYDAPAEKSEHSMLERLATAVLGGSTSGRLFTEVRQKRSLSYSVGASYRAGRDRGLVAVSAGTTPDRAQETLDVTLGEIDRFFDGGVTPEEFDRAAIGLKSHVIMQGESTPARAAALAGDQFRLGRPRSLEELAGTIDALTVVDLNAYLDGRTPGPLTVVSIGPSSLTVPASSAPVGSA